MKHQGAARNTDWDREWEKNLSTGNAHHASRNWTRFVLMLSAIVLSIYIWERQPLCKSRNGDYTVIVERESEVHFPCNVWKRNQIIASEDLAFGDTEKPNAAQVQWTGATTFNIIFYQGRTEFETVAVDLRKADSTRFRWRYGSLD